MNKPGRGKILVSEPFLEDPNFRRTVIVIVDHGTEGTVGYVLNHETVLRVADLFDDFESEEPVFLGGPVGQNSFHYLHNIENLEGTTKIMNGVFWGGDFEQLQYFLKEDLSGEIQIRFFAGYSGWAPEQLGNEIELKSWIVAEGMESDIFGNPNSLWKRILGRLGGEFAWLGNAPDDVHLN
ncbi:MAG: YqgE/AlgH family protein [Bacteroidetes bacterium]|nr:YqgE/AlgH family protein [Bacteroidota bacterium]